LAVLSGAARAVITAHIQRPQQVFGALGTLTKADLRAAVDATDQWIDDNAAAYNTALSQPARGALTADQKTLLFCFVALRRAGLLRAEGE
jgi:hypothetical protein